MTISRDSSGGYLTGDESERLWDREEEDAYTAELLGDEDDGSASDLDVLIEATWTRADAISKEIAEIEETLDRARSTTIFDPTDLSTDEMQVRLGALAQELGRPNREHTPATPPSRAGIRAAGQRSMLQEILAIGGLRDPDEDEAVDAIGVAANRWPLALEMFRTADQDTALSALDLDALGSAAWWMGQLGQAITARERAYTAYMAAADTTRAAGIALALASDYGHRLEHSIASGWVRRAQRLLAKEPESRQHALPERRQERIEQRAVEDGALGHGLARVPGEFVDPTAGEDDRFGEPATRVTAVDPGGQAADGRGFHVPWDRPTAGREL